ncbi:MAG: PAS domain-containing protein, partial [Kamptonema sp. SIO4C4]|nr:PAS domain-containing protein [Kamptonema sp. SIO4C4]
MTLDLLYSRIPDILVADDTLDSLKLLSNALSERGYDVRSVTNGTLALASARAAPPDLILLDIKMPDLSGYEVCEQLKQEALTQEIPVIFISALHEPFDKVKAFGVGGVDYITKPFQLEEVLVRIQSQLERYFSLRQVQTLNNELEQRVEERTAQLTEINRTLQQEIADRQRIEESLRESERKFRQISEHIQEVFWLVRYDAELQGFSVTEYVSPAFADIWGKPCEFLYENPRGWTETIYPEDRQRVDKAFREQVSLGSFDEEYRIMRPDGSVRWIRDRGFPITDDQGQVYRVAGIAEDITERKQAELERDRFFNLSLDLLFISDRNGNFRRLNLAWTQLLGYSQQELIGQSFWQLIHPDDRAAAQAAQEQLNLGEPVNTLELRCRSQEGSYYWMAWNTVPFLQENLLYGAGRNISQRKESEARLVHETLHDSLTGLANRTHFMQRLEMAIKNRNHNHYRFAVLFIDLDDFKRVNDTLGHLIGDRLLMQVSGILQASVRDIDSVAR